MATWNGTSQCCDEGRGEANVEGNYVLFMFGVNFVYGKSMVLFVGSVEFYFFCHQMFWAENSSFLFLKISNKEQVGKLFKHKTDKKYAYFILLHFQKTFFRNFLFCSQFQSKICYESIANGGQNFTK